MNKLFVIGGVALLLVAGTVIGKFYSDKNEFDQKLQELGDISQDKQNLNSGPEYEGQDELLASLISINETLDNMNRSIVQMAGAINELNGNQSIENRSKPLMSPLDEDEQLTMEKASSNPRQELYKTLGGEQMSIAFGAMGVERRFGRFIDSLNRPEDEKQRVRQILGNLLAERNKLGMQLVSGNIPENYLLNRETQEQLDEKVRQELSEVLYPDEIDQYFVHQDANLRDYVKNRYSPFIEGLQGKGLTEANKGLVMNVVEEEMRAALRKDSPTIGGIGNFAASAVSGNAAQVAAISTIKERLSKQISAGQMSVVDSFLTMQMALLDPEQAIGSYELQTVSDLPDHQHDGDSDHHH